MENMEQEEHQKNVPEEPCHEATSLDSYYKIPWEALYHEAPGLALYHNVPRLPCSYKFPESPVLSRFRGYPVLLMFLGCPILLRFLGCLVLTRLLGWPYITRFQSWPHFLFLFLRNPFTRCQSQGPLAALSKRTLLLACIWTFLGYPGITRLLAWPVSKLALYHKVAWLALYNKASSPNSFPVPEKVCSPKVSGLALYGEVPGLICS